MLKTAYHFLLLLVGFNTLTYQKDYNIYPILAGHNVPPRFMRNIAGWKETGEEMAGNGGMFIKRTTKKYTSVMIRVCHSRSHFLSCMYMHDKFMTE